MIIGGNFMKEAREIFDEQYEIEKAMYMYQAYPCLRNEINSYVSLIKERVIGQEEAIKNLVYVIRMIYEMNFQQLQ